MYTSQSKKEKNTLRKRGRRRPAAHNKKYKENMPERVSIDDIADWLPSWVFSRQLSDAELRGRVRGRSL